VYIAIIRTSFLDVTKHGIGDRGSASTGAEAALFDDPFLMRGCLVEMFQVLLLFVLLHNGRVGRLRGVFWVVASRVLLRNG
jgi:hypothetical protein